MLWLALALLSAFFPSLVDVFGKKCLSRSDEMVVGWAVRAVAVAFMAPALLITGIPSLGARFWLALLVSGGINTLTTVLYVKAIKGSHLSLAVPMVSFTPLFLVATSPLIAREFPGAGGIAGIILIVLGSYLLNLNHASKGPLAPFRALLREKGPRLMLLAAFLWSISSAFDKVGVTSSSPLLWTVAVNCFVAALLTPAMLRRFSSGERRIAACQASNLVALGLSSALGNVFYVFALSMGYVAYVIAVKRTSIILTGLWAIFHFREEGASGRLLGILVMVAGVALIALA